MTIDYHKVWNTMNELESVTSKICSAREILACAIDAHESGNASRTETLLYAVDEYLQYYLAEFDKKFKDAWKETVTKINQEDNDVWNAVIKEKEYYVEPTSAYSSRYYDYTRNDSNRPNPFDKVVKWILPIEEIDCDECIINFPDDLLEAANLKEGDEIEWIDQGDGSYLIKKVTKPLGIDEC